MKTFVIATALFLSLLNQSCLAQRRNFMEVNTGFTKYNSPQNNLDFNPGFGISVFNQLNRKMGLEMYCSAIKIDETEMVYDSNGLQQKRREESLAGWFGGRIAFGGHSESRLIVGFVGASFRLDRNVITPEFGGKFGFRIAQSNLWFHASSCFQIDKYAFYNFQEKYALSGPVKAGKFWTGRIGFALHFN